MKTLVSNPNLQARLMAAESDDEFQRIAGEPAVASTAHLPRELSEDDLREVAGCYFSWCSTGTKQKTKVCGMTMI